MASSRAKTTRTSSNIKKEDGSIFACSCKSTEFRVIEEPLHLFCKCGQVYTFRDLEGSA